MTAKALVEAIGALVIFLTLAGLGLFQVPSDEPTIEAGLRAQATVLLADYPDPPVLTVKGRVLTVEGLVQSNADRRAIERALRAIDGVEELRAKLEVLPRVGRFTFSLGKDDKGTRLGGHVTAATTAEALGRVTGAPVTPLQVARGAPFGDWDKALLVLAESAALLHRAEVDVSGTSGTIRGEALWSAEARAVAARLDTLPKSLSIKREISVRDDGAPFLLVAERHPRRGVSLRGKLPPGLNVQALTGAFDSVQDNALVAGPVDPDLPDLGPAMTGAIKVLAAAEQGIALVTPGAVVLTSLRGGAEMDKALTALRADMPASYRLDVSQLPETPPQPFWLQLDRLNGAVMASGVLPEGIPPEELSKALGADVSRLSQAPYPDTLGWAASMAAVQDAFAEVIEGGILLEEASITLDAVLADPDSAVRVETRLAALPQGADLRSYIELQDDGRDPDATLTYHPETGLSLDGVLPVDLDAAAIAGLLGLPPADGAIQQDQETALPRAAPFLKAVAPWLGEAETLTITLAVGKLTVEGVLSPGVDLEQIEAATRAALGPNDRLTLSVLQDYPPTDTRRQNVALGAEQVFLAGYWLPLLEFAPSVAECARQSRLAESDEPVRFLSGETRLDARSIRGVNALSAVARVCVGRGGLRLRVEGHTDNFGAEGVNRMLSRLRAEVVATEIAKRGVPEVAMEVLGYGPDRPVADNATPEGRARNRRISLAWSTPGQSIQ
ncbi:OmpA family protein [Mameliella sp. CS4]|uniref:OmpA family protein n=1 Tax=Mameliella sp. CS4 TaxID=2862329 RepID=UPI001C5F1B7D|nr:OmpA family protein [Mameliella sp. CS4]MBW4985017.1 OmpA family protein [Mameliella sp. CS4]